MLRIRIPPMYFFFNLNKFINQIFNVKLAVGTHRQSQISNKSNEAWNLVNEIASLIALSLIYMYVFYKILFA